MTFKHDRLRDLKMTDAIATDQPLQGTKVFCFEDHEVTLEELAAEIEAETGLKVIAKFEGDTVDGFLTSRVVKNAEKDDDCSWCGCSVMLGQRHQCVIVSFYAEAAEPEAQIANDPHPRKSRLRKPVLGQTKVNKIEGAFTKHREKLKDAKSFKNHN